MINLLGEEEAFQMACQARYENQGRLIISADAMIPCKPRVDFEIKKVK